MESTDHPSPELPSDGMAIERLIDQQCDRFESAWLEGPVPRIEDFLPANWTLADRRVLLLDLIQLDLEYRWSTAQPPSAEGVEGGKSSGGVEGTGGQPRARVEDYLARFADTLGDPASWLAELAVHEYRVQHLHEAGGPRLEEFHRRFPQAGPSLAGRLRAAAAELCPLRLLVFESQRLQWRMRFRSPLEIGRQRSSEPPPYELSEQRLLVARVDETTVSRKQLSLDLVTCERLRIANTCRKNDVQVDNQEGSRILRKGEALESAVPVQISFGRRVVRIERDE